MTPRIEIWFEFASTYSYLTLMRAEAELARAGVGVVWRPFLLGRILKRKGITTSPFNLDPPRGAHMWRDLERRAALFGLPFTRPAVFPMNGSRAARVMTAARDEPWAGDFARAVASAAFARGEDIGDGDAVGQALRAVGEDPAPWLARAEDDAVRAELRARTDEAADQGIFGAPTFRVGRELFWGDDRLDEAILWALGRHPALSRHPGAGG